MGATEAGEMAPVLGELREAGTRGVGWWGWVPFQEKRLIAFLDPSVIKIGPHQKSSWTSPLVCVFSEVHRQASALDSWLRTPALGRER